MDSSYQPSEEENLYCYPDINGSCTKLYRSPTTLAILYFLCGMTMIATIFGNLLVIIVIAHFKVLHSPTNVLSLSLALTDCLLGILVLPFCTVRSVETCWYFGDGFCRVHTGLDTLFCLASVFHLCFISIDRYCAICNPFRYPSLISVRVVCVSVAAGWVITTVYTYGMLYSKDLEEALVKFVPNKSCIGGCQLVFMTLWGWVNFPVFFLPCFLMMGLYVKIFIVAKKQAKLIADSSQCTAQGRASKRERKAAKTLGVAVSVYVLCWVPFIVDTMLESFYTSITPPLLFDFLMWSTYLNSACNPIIYGFFYPWFRKALKIIITGKIFHKGSSTINLFQD
ncbi:trace amine-associated receptor 5-like [Protopterus annectens]|uniref:trace amine-associated receptor 5-like n=1 Tax=Protopterus annectens TaxID=7888 RepID=UPI001CFA84B5|nr:trace amine-associated receptor 5-like [Protopterus annectens]